MKFRNRMAVFLAVILVLCLSITAMKQDTVSGYAMEQTESAGEASVTDHADSVPETDNRSEDETAAIMSGVTLDGKEPGDARFTFVLTDFLGNETGRVQNEDDGTIDFGAYVSDKAGTYHYTIRQIHDGQKGIVYDEKTIAVTVKVSDSAPEIAGKTVTGYYHDGYDNQEYYYMKDRTTGQEYHVFCLNDTKHMPYGNSYTVTQDPSDSAIISSLVKQSAEHADKVKRLLYYFTIHPDEYKPFVQQEMIWEAGGTDGGKAAEISRILSEVENVPSNFHMLYFSNGDSTYQALLGGYLVPEPEITYQTSDGTGDWFANTTAEETEEPKEPEEPEEPDEPEAEDTGSGQGVITAEKTLDGQAPGDRTFTFELADADGTVIQKKTNASDGSIVFDPIDYDEPGTYRYTIREIDDGQKGIIYDEKTVAVTVKASSSASEIAGKTVTGYFHDDYDNQEYYYMKDRTTGQEYHVFCLNDTRHMPYGNSYNVTQDPSDSAIISSLVTQSAECADKVKRLLYYFTIHPDEYKPFVQQEMIWEAGGTDGGKASEISRILSEVKTVPSNFHMLYFSNGDSTYQALLGGYLVPEPDITYQTSDGTETALFANTTEKEPDEPEEPDEPDGPGSGSGQGVITAEKTLDGRKPGDRTFTFELADEDGTVIQKKTNTSDGSIVFDPIDYDEPGTYRYTIREIDDGQKGIVYDDRTVSVSVEAASEHSNINGKNVYGSQESMENYYVQDPSDGQKYHAYCLHPQKIRPNGVYYSAQDDVSDETIQASTPGGSADNVENIRKVLYYFYLHPDAFKNDIQQEIVWQAAGAGYGQADRLDQILDAVDSVPSDFHITFLKHLQSNYQDLILGYTAEEPVITYQSSDGTETALFENRTRSAETVELPETGGTGTFPVVMAGFSALIITLTLSFIFLSYSSEPRIHHKDCKERRHP